MFNSLSIPKFLAAVVGIVGAYIASLPADAHQAAGVAIWFLVLDTVSGVVAARIKGKVTSRGFRLGLMDKAICYAIIVGFAAGLAEISKQPVLYSFAWWGVCAAEGFSIIENLRVMLKRGGKSMHPLAVVLDRFASVIDKITGQFDVPEDSPVDANVNAPAAAPVPEEKTEAKSEEAEALATPEGKPYA